MVLMTSIIVVITAVSVYDYYSAKNWQQLTSPNRNDVVFENRNQKYGAYALRRDYDKRVMLILLSFISSIGISYGAFLFFRNPIVQFSDNHSGQNYIPMVIPPKDEPEKQEKPKEEEPKEESGPKQDQTQSTEFRDPIVEDDDTDNQIPPNDAMDTTAVSNVTNPNGISGTSGGGGTGDNGNGKEKDTIDDSNNIPEFPFKDAEFPGGAEARTKFITNKTNYPEEGMAKGGKCYLRFVVGKDGEISSVNIERGVPDCPGCDKEAVRVIRLMPRWRPAETNTGRKIPSYFRLTINFQPPKD